MRKKYLKNSTISLGLGVSLVVLSIYSSNFLIGADGSTSAMSQGVEVAKIALVTGVIMIGISIGLFVLAVIKSE
jgi:hypothetical protein